MIQNPLPKIISRVALLLGASTLSVNAAVTPGGTLGDSAVITESGGGEALVEAGTTGGFGPVLVHDFDGAAGDPTYEFNPSGSDATQIALSSGRHAVMYSTRFQGTGTGNRCEIRSNLTLAGSALDEGMSQGLIRNTGGGNDTVLSGGAIVTVAADDDILTLESLRTDVNTAAADPTRVGGFTSVQLLKLGNSWDFLSVSRTGDQGGSVNTTPVKVAYGTIDPATSLGTAFSFTSGSTDVTLNETGNYLVFANTGIEGGNSNANVRTNYQQYLTLDGVEVGGSKTTTYVRGNANGERAYRGVASYGTVLSAVAGQVLSVEVVMEPTGSAGTIKGGQTALTIVKLPVTAKTLSLIDGSSQEVNDAAVDPVTFDTLSGAPISELSHTLGDSIVTVNTSDDYLFFGSVFTQSDAANDNQDRIIPLHGWQIDGSGGMVNYGHGAAYNRDNGNNRTSGSWGAGIFTLNAGQTAQLMTQGIGNGDQGASSVCSLQALSLSSLVLSNDPAIALNLPLEVIPGSTTTITNASLSTFDGDTPPSGLTYTVDSVPAGGTLQHTVNGALGSGSTFTQDDIDNNRIEFVAGGAEASGGFDFSVSDGSASDASTFIINVAWPTVSLTITSGGEVQEGDTAEWVVNSDIAPVGADITVDIAYSGIAADGSDFTGISTVTISDGSTAGGLVVNTLVDGLYEGSENIIATITGATGATTNPVIGTPASATVLLSDSGNRAPTGSNMSQTIITAPGTIPLGDITVIDPDSTFTSSVVTASPPLTDTNGKTGVTVFSDNRPDDNDASFDIDATGPGLSQAAGFSLQLLCTPRIEDMTGVVDLWEIGGSSNGSALVLVDGIPHISVKANGGAGDTPTDTADPGFVDTDWATGNQVIFPLQGTPLTPGEESQIAVIFDISGNTVKSSVNGAAELVTGLTPQSGLNHLGDHTFNVGKNAGTGTGSSNNGSGVMGTTDPGVILNPRDGSATMARVRYWNESSGSIAATAGVSEMVTATLTIMGWSAGAGDLTAASGNGETYGAGVWTVSGDLASVNAALAAVEFVSDVSSADPTVIQVALEDGDEDGSGPTPGSIVISSSQPDPVYVDDSFSALPGSTIADADGGSAVSPAIAGFSAFSTISEALANVAPGGTVVVNDGDYTGESLNLDNIGMITLRITDSAGPVQIGDLQMDQGNSLEITGSNTLVVGFGNNGSRVIDCVISGSGNLTKVGTGMLILRDQNTFTGTTTIDDGILRIGYESTKMIDGSLGGDGPVVVNAPGVIEFNTQVGVTTFQTGAISGTGEVRTLADGTLVFDGAGPNTFSGGLMLGDGTTSSFDGVDQGAVQGFVVVNQSGHLGTGKILSRGSQLRAGSPGVVIPNDIDITGGGLRLGGTVDFGLSGTIQPIDNATRGIGNYGLDGLDITIDGNIVMTAGTTNVNFEGVNNKDNGSITVNGDISGPASLLIQATLDGGEVFLNGNLSHAGTTICQAGETTFNGNQTGGGAWSVQTGSTLYGNGTTTSPLTVDSGATFSAGAASGAVGTFTTGDLTINGIVVFDMAGSTTPGTDYDQVVANGTVTLSGIPNVSFDPGIMPGTLTLISNDDVDAINGTFTGFPEGAMTDPASFGWEGTISYLGGDGNDVELDFGGLTTIGQWRLVNYGDPSNTGAGENSALGGNGLTNLENFALGFDADGTGGAGTLTIDAGTITSTGLPAIWIDPATGRYYFQYTRRADFAAAGLDIEEQFSRALSTWEVDAASVAAVVATGTGDDGVAIQALRVELPGTLPIGGGKARYARLAVTITP